jgi:hypothetical protein
MIELKGKIIKIDKIRKNDKIRQHLQKSFHFPFFFFELKPSDFLSVETDSKSLDYNQKLPN